MFYFLKMKKIFFIACIVSLLSAPSFAQHRTTNVVGYDPLFWKAELRLNTEQCLRLRDINIEFYKSLEACANDNAKHGMDKVKIIELLSDRSEKILSVFSDRQRKKWDKIATTYQGNIVARLTPASLSTWARN